MCSTKNIESTCCVQTLFHTFLCEMEGSSFKELRFQWWRPDLAADGWMGEFGFSGLG